MAHIAIVGLGPGEWERLTLEAVAALNSHEEIWLATRHHPLVAQMPAHLNVQSFDALHELDETPEVLAASLAREVLRLGQRPQGVLYAVPGHPWVGEPSVPLIVAGAEAAGIPCRLIDGLSFIEPTLALIGYDPFAGFQLVDALTLATAYYPPVDGDRPLLVAQLYSRLVAREVKRCLHALYPADHPVTLIHGSGTHRARRRLLPLERLDQHSDFSDHTSLWVPALDQPASLPYFQNIVAHLRSPEGCPWDREQDHDSLRRFDLEEAYEVVAAIDQGEPEALSDELGDQLLMILMHAQIAQEEGAFTMVDVIRGIADKMIRRHPHVFATTEVEDAAEVLRNWEAIKAAEKGAQAQRDPLAEIPQALPALMRAARVTRHLAKEGHPLPEPAAAFAAWQSQPGEEEMGTLLLALAAQAAQQKQEPEELLRQAVGRLIAARE